MTDSPHTPQSSAPPRSGGVRRDAAGRALAVAVQLLPPEQREWGMAMRAELDAVTQRDERRRFATGCVAAIATRPAVWRRVAYALLPASVVAYVVLWSATIDWAPRRWGVVVFAAVLAVVAELGVVGPLGPVAPSRAARFARAFGYLLVGALAVELDVSIAHKDNNDLTGVPVLSVVLAVYLAATLAMTGRRARATSRSLLLGLAGGTTAAAAWALVVLLAPPIPPGPGFAAALTAAGMALTILLTPRRDPMAALRAALIAGTTGALLIFNAVVILSSFGPPDLIPSLAPHALTPADQLTNSRIELVDPYLWLLLLGWFVAVGQWMAARSPAAPAVTAPPPAIPAEEPA
ncbi:hypothetical protein ACQPZX_36725 [Actinoplanes sp. CA-142083]|uniref:hypothetical protein n=1 Tax=Actinoplanes sp. CA-142083 TaxID=3239903 RepID=UPI003D946745